MTPAPRSTGCPWPTAAREPSRPWWPRPAGTYPQRLRHRPARRAGHRVVRPARRRPHGGHRDGRGLGSLRSSRRTGAIPGEPRPGAPASCCWRRSRPGARRVIVGIGGSATNDGGAGLGQALGFRLLDAEGRELGPGGGALGRLAGSTPPGRRAAARPVGDRRRLRRDQPALRPAGRLGRLRPAERGRPRRWSPQLDRNLAHFAAIVAARPRPGDSRPPRRGAAGGLGGGPRRLRRRAAPARASTLVIDAVGLRNASAAPTSA